MTKHKLQIGRRAYTISIHTIPGSCCWATVYLGRRRIGETRDIPYGMSGVAYEQASKIAEAHANTASA